MFRLCMLLLLVALSGCFAVATLYSHRLTHQSWPAFIPKKSLGVESVIQKDNRKHPVEKYFTQKLDHFTATNKITFQQRYFWSTKYNTTKGLYFLWVEGIMELSPLTVSDLPIVDNARTFGATLIALEHRFYGKSKPFDTLETSNLAYLNSRQAVEDIADFIRGQNRVLRESNSTWVLFGGSYGGSLALWFRQKYPALSAGVIASSPQAVPMFNFYQYLSRVEEIYKVWNSTCYEKIAASFKDIHKFMQNTKGRTEISKVMLLSPEFDQLSMNYHDFQFFYYILINYFAATVHFSNQDWGMDQVCEVMCKNSGASPLGKMKDVLDGTLEELTGIQGTFQLSNNYTSFVEQLKNISYQDPDVAMERMEHWRRCSEMGYGLTSDFGGKFFGTMIPNNFHLELCLDVFGPTFTYDYIKKSIDFTQNWYNNTDTYKGKNAVIIQGEFDSYATVGYKSVSDKKNSVYYQIKSGHHCTDISGWNKHNVAGVIIIRTLVARTLRKWLPKKSSPQVSIKLRDASPTLSEAQTSQLTLFSDILNFNVEVEFNAPTSEFDLKLVEYPSCESSLFSTAPCMFKQNPKVSVQRVPGASSFQQWLDHFDKNNKKMWTQKFYHSSTYRKEGGPVFLWLCERNYAGYIGKYMAYMDWARALNATMVSLGSRFFGENQPTGDLMISSLKYMTIEQTLADAVTFIAAANKKYGNVKWITFGCGYGGNLAAWLRLKFPNHVVGAVASSAPIQAEVDFAGNLQMAQNDIIKYGTDGCAENVRALFAHLQNLTTTTEGRKNISKVAKLCKRWVGNNVPSKDIDTFFLTFLNSLLNAIIDDSEKHDSLRNWCDTTKAFSDKLNAGSNDETDNFRQLFSLTNLQKVSQITKKACLEVSYKKIISNLKHTSLTSFWGNTRVIFWQKCTSMGQMLSTNIGYNLFESSLPINYYLDICTDVFGPNFNRTFLDKAVATTNLNYGGNTNYAGTNVVFVDGDADPYYSLSYIPRSTMSANNITRIVMPGNTHCEDMWTHSNTTATAVVAAHATIKKVLTGWVTGN